MSQLWERWNKARAQSKVEIKGGADFEALPLLSQLLSGKAQEGGADWEIPPYKLLLWLEGDYLKWCITAGDDLPKLWGAISGLALGLDGIEQAIAQDKCDWRSPKPNGKLLTHLSR